MSLNEQKPRYWTTMEELNGSDTVEQIRREEFFSKPAEMMNEAGEVNFHLSRRDLLKLTGAAMVLATVGCARRPVEKIIPYVVAPEEITPGVAVWYASTCSGCAAQCGTLVKTREGRPIKLEGNPNHPVNHGKLCARGQATVLDLYDPDRLQQPTKYYRGKRTPEQVTFAQADEAILAALKKAPGKIAIVGNHQNGVAMKRVWREFAAAFPGVSLFQYDPLGEDDLLRAQSVVFGTTVRPRYRYDQAQYLVLFGHDPFGNSASPVEAAHGYGIMRKPSKEDMAKVVSFEPAMTLSGANADERFLISPDDLAPIAYSLAYVLTQMGRNAFEKEEDNQKLRNVLSAYAPSKIEKNTNLPEGLIKRLAKEINRYRGKSLVVAGSTAVQGNNSLALQIAVSLVNVLLENEGRTVDGSTWFSQQRLGTQRDLIEFTKELKAGKFDTVIFAGTNPLYHAPAELGIAEALQSVNLVVSLADRIDETALQADWILPLSHGLETWSDVAPVNGLYAIKQPVITPLYTTRSVEENLLAWTTAATKAGAAVPTMLEFIQETWKQTFMAEASTNTFIEWWNDKLRDGFFGTAKTDVAVTPRKVLPESVNAIRTKHSDPVDLQLVLQTTAISYDGTQRNNAWLMETPDPVSKVSWDNHLSLSPSRAKKLGVQTGDIVKLTLGSTNVEVPVYIQPGVHANVALLALGWGRTAGGRIANKVGTNGFPLTQVSGDQIQFSGLSITLTKTGRTHKLANMQGHNYIEGRPIVQETTFDKWRENPESGGHHRPEMTSMWGAPPKALNPPAGEPVRWWMSIDLNSCIGCNACSVACQAENNISVVGKEQVLRGREMAWIRIDRYYSGDEENPEVIHQPMLCQHCSHAPCETVCPVVATTHNDEGLNVQTYNRCVGTRYCSNNCPYKVRRFNWLADNTAYSSRNIQHPMEMVLNPDVTVRSIGVMEKCTFCTQRIREGHDYRKTNGLQAIPDGQVKPACAQTCPTNAITFGNILNKESKIAEVSQDPRGFLVLEDLNTRPAITYLRKLRHRMPKTWDEAEHHNGGEHAAPKNEEHDSGKGKV
ncbi:MAG: TAT-variant-translocated molybdopterin oxidoreductase [bacterium]|nr:TAT-variant-translocated molybdopterin oxidoreductase [bacterium]